MMKIFPLAAEFKSVFVFPFFSNLAVQVQQEMGYRFESSSTLRFRGTNWG